MARGLVNRGQLARLLERFRRPLRSFTARIGTAPSPAQVPWSQPPAFASVPEEKIALLRTQPIHQLTLSDLVKYE